MLAGLQKRLADQQLTLTVTPEAKELLIQGGYDPLYGARPLRRYLQQQVETLLARYIIGQDPAAGTHLTVDVQDGKLTVRAEAAPAA